MKCAICDIEMNVNDAVRFGPEYSHSKCFNILFWYSTFYVEVKNLPWNLPHKKRELTIIG